MKVIIVGAGAIGAHLADLFSKIKQNIVIIDDDEEKLERIQSECDLMTIHASSSIPIKSLKEAGVKNADLFIAVTRDENLNLSLCVLAKSMADMEQDINGYISNLEQTTNDLITARENAELMNQAANIDALTKVRNKRAYNNDIQHLNENAKSFGIVMIDMNGLKAINDTYGHEKGDIGIITICQNICRIFKHSPVYRIGGDEFVVILENDDYDERDSLLESLRARFEQLKNDESLEPWERVTAAIGCATYDPHIDNIVESVLQRADALMYENKKEMKAERKS